MHAAGTAADSRVDSAALVRAAAALNGAIGYISAAATLGNDSGTCATA